MPWSADLSTTSIKIINTIDDEKPEIVELVYKALVMGIREYFAKNRLQRCVIGLSGGIDSALVCALAVAALGADNVHGILMPSQYSTDHSVKDAEDLANNLGVKYDIVPIKDCFDALRSLFLATVQRMLLKKICRPASAVPY